MSIRRRNLVLASTATLALPAFAQSAAFPNKPIKLLIAFPAGGPTDITMRALADNASKILGQSVVVENKPGAGGTLPAQQLQTSAADGYTVAQIPLGVFRLPYTTKISWDPVKDIAYVINVTGYAFGIVVPADSPLKTMKDVVEQMKKDPGSVKWGGGSKGSTEHISASMLAGKVGVDPKKVNYVAFRGGGEATAAILGGNVTVGGSGYSEFAEFIASGKMKPIAVTSDTRLKGVAVPTLKEQGIDVVIGNWRGVYGAPGITPAQRKDLTDLVIKATKSNSWTEASEKNKWTAAVLTGPAFEKFVDDDFASLRATMVKSGMI